MRVVQQTEKVGKRNSLPEKGGELLSWDGRYGAEYPYGGAWTLPVSNEAEALNGVQGCYADGHPDCAGNEVIDTGFKTNWYRSKY